MALYWIINNYQLGSKWEITPTEKIIEQTRLDRSHIRVVYDGLTPNEIQLCEKCFGRTGKSIEDRGG